MAGDDETIVIRVNATQGEVALKALGNAGVQATAGIEGMAAPINKAGFELKEMTKSIGAGISIIGILRDNLEALKPALEQVGGAIKFAASQAGADTETVTNLGRAFDSLIHPSHIAANAVESLQAAWVKLRDSMVEGSTVVPHNVRTIEESLAALGAARKAAATTATEAATVEAEAAEEIAVAEESATARVAVAIESRVAALDAEVAAAQDRLKTALDKGGKVDSSEDTSAVTDSLAGVKAQIDEIEGSVLISPEQGNQLLDLKRKANDLTNELSDMNTVFTVTRDDFLTEGEAADAAAAAWDVYGSMLDKAQAIHEGAMDDFEQSQGTLSDVGQAAGFVGDSLLNAAEAGDDLGDSIEKGVEKGSEAMKDLIAGANEVLPVLHEIRDVLAEIVTLGSQADI